MTEKISGGAFKQMVAFGAACITREKQAINDLNVFPVPDGDTGTNMSLTIQTAAAELKKCEPATVGEAAKITASALLRGARGNSGVILSLLFRGLSKSAKGLEEMDGVQLAAAFRDLGVDRVVSGGQTMNPSTEAILREVNHTPSEIVFVLPNNKNIVMAAQQCVGLTEKQVIVVPTHSIPQGISAMMSVDTAEEDPQAILAAMTEAAAAVTTAQITYAARNSDFDGFAINEGDYLALLDGKLFGTERDITSLLTRLAALAAEREAAFVTLFYGEGVSQEEAEAAQALFTEACPETEISLLSGGQPVYYYTISIE